MWAIDLIKSLMKQGFWGTIELKFQNGKIVLVDERKTHKPPKGTT